MTEITPVKVTLRISVECIDPGLVEKQFVEDSMIECLVQRKPGLADHYGDGTLSVVFFFTGPGKLELHTLKGRPRRLVDRRSA